MLPSILLDIVRKDIESRSAYVADDEIRSRNASDIGRLIDMVQSLADGSLKPVAKSAGDNKPKKQMKPVQVISNISADLDLDDDFMAMMK